MSHRIPVTYGYMPIDRGTYYLPMQYLLDEYFVEKYAKNLETLKMEGGLTAGEVVEFLKDTEELTDEVLEEDAYATLRRWIGKSLLLWTSNSLPDSEKLHISEYTTVYMAMTNTDLTEGRGQEYPRCVCESEVTARRLGKGQYVMGSDCRVEEKMAVKFGGGQGGGWLVPGRIVPPSLEDERAIQDYKTQRELFERLRRMGISSRDLKALSEHELDAKKFEQMEAGNE